MFHQTWHHHDPALESSRQTGRKRLMWRRRVVLLFVAMSHSQTRENQSSAQWRRTIIQQQYTKLPKSFYDRLSYRKTIHCPWLRSHLKTKLRGRPSTTKGNDGMIWENWERDVVLVENILLYFVIVITFVAFVIVLGCSCYKFFRYRECF